MSYDLTIGTKSHLELNKTKFIEDKFKKLKIKFTLKPINKEAK
jgi:hypothetical protein